MYEIMQKKNLAEKLGHSECSINDSHAALVPPCKLEADPEKFAPYLNQTHHCDLTVKHGTAQQSL